MTCAQSLRKVLSSRPRRLAAGTLPAGLRLLLPSLSGRRGRSSAGFARSRQGAREPAVRYCVLSFGMVCGLRPLCLFTRLPAFLSLHSSPVLSPGRVRPVSVCVTLPAALLRGLRRAAPSPRRSADAAAAAPRRVSGRQGRCEHPALPSVTVAICVSVTKTNTPTPINVALHNYHMVPSPSATKLSHTDNSSPLHISV